MDYAALKVHPQDLNRYLDQVAAINKTDFKKWSEPQQIAFLSNAYNAYTLRLIIDHYPLRSIKKRRWLIALSGKAKPVFGVILIFVTVGILSGLDKKLEALVQRYLPES